MWFYSGTNEKYLIPGILVEQDGNRVVIHAEGRVSNFGLIVESLILYACLSIPQVHKNFLSKGSWSYHNGF